MNYPILSYRIFPLGDSALTIYFGNLIDEDINKKVLALFYDLRLEPLPGMTEAVPAYSSLTVYYDVFAIIKGNNPGTSAYEFMRYQLDQRLTRSLENDNSTRHITIPVCYEKEYAPDMEYLAKEKNLTEEEVVRLHTSKPYRVYMLGFLPGFGYMGKVDEKIAISRKPQPRQVTGGSVGIAGSQTGVYSMTSPGGWQIIGRTPLKIFDAEKEDPAFLKAGDTVHFISISKNEFESY